MGNISLWFYIPKYVKKKYVKDLNIIKHIRPTISLFIPQIAIQVYTVLDKTMIGYILKDMTEVGNYEQSQKIIKFALIIVTSMGTVIIPRIANTFANNNKEEIKRYLEKTFNIVWMLGIPIMFGIMAISYKFVPWFLGDGFEESKILLIVGAPLIMAIGLNNVSGMQYLIPTKQQNIFTKSVIIGAVLNFGINLIFIPIFKSIGAIIASVMAETIILIVQLIYIRKDVPLKFVYQNCFKYIISGIIMLAIIVIVGNFLNASMVTTFIQIIAGAIIYFLALIIFKDKLILEFFDKLKNFKLKGSE